LGQQAKHGERELRVVSRQPLGLLSEPASLESLVFLAQEQVEFPVLVALASQTIPLELDACDASQQLGELRFCGRRCFDFSGGWRTVTMDGRCLRRAF
jgi:hypothetical protein